MHEPHALAARRLSHQSLMSDLTEKKWWAWQGLNLRPLRCQHSALPLSYTPTPGRLSDAAAAVQGAGSAGRELGRELVQLCRDAVRDRVRSAPGHGRPAHDPALVRSGEAE